MKKGKVLILGLLIVSIFISSAKAECDPEQMIEEGVPDPFACEELDEAPLDSGVIFLIVAGILVALCSKKLKQPSPAN